MALGSGDEKRVWFPILLAAVGVTLVALVQLHVGSYLRSGNSVRWLLGAGVAGLLAGMLAKSLAHSRACSAVECRNPAGGTADSGVLVSALVRGGLVIGMVALAYCAYQLIPHYDAPAYRAFMKRANPFLFVYAGLAIPYYYFSFRLFPQARWRSGDKPAILAVWIRRLWRCRFRPDRTTVRAAYRSRRTRTAVLSLVVKAFFLPLMFSSVMGQSNFLMVHLAVLEESRTMSQFFFAWLLPFIGKACLFLDVLIASCAYGLEFRWLRNRIKSVDPYLSGWIVCLACYYPFHAMWASYLPAASGDPAAWAETVWASRAQALIIAALQALWLAPTLCLGFRASNLTNRGVVGFGPYRWIRHPQYAFRMPWIVFDIFPRIHHWQVSLSAAVMLALYVARCLTEERHLRADSDYRAYCAQVKFRLLPRVW